MNKKLQFLSYLIVFIGCSKVIDEEALIEKSSVTYAKGSTVPFTGEIMGKYDSGQERIKGAYIDVKEKVYGSFYIKMVKKVKRGNIQMVTRKVAGVNGTRMGY